MTKVWVIMRIQDNGGDKVVSVCNTDEVAIGRRNKLNAIENKHYMGIYVVDSEP